MKTNQRAKPAEHFVIDKSNDMCSLPGYENLFFQLTARHPAPDNPNWKLFQTEGDVTTYRIVDDFNNCVWEKDVRPDGVRYLLGIYEDNPITRIKGYEIMITRRLNVPIKFVGGLPVAEFYINGNSIPKRFPMSPEGFEELMKSIKKDK